MGLRERTRQAVRTDIAATAMRLFLEQGFDATTMEQIATEAGISRRSLFRYFDSKEDIALGDVAERGAQLQELLRERPDSEGPWEALRAALDTFAKGTEFTLDWAVKMSAMFHETPSLRARQMEKQLRWMEQLAPEVARRLGADPDDRTDPRAQAIVASALACLDAAIDAWTLDGATRPVEDYYDAAVAAVRN